MVATQVYAVSNLASGHYFEVPVDPGADVLETVRAFLSTSEVPGDSRSGFWVSVQPIDLPAEDHGSDDATVAAGVSVPSDAAGVGSEPSAAQAGSRDQWVPASGTVGDARADDQQPAPAQAPAASAAPASLAEPDAKHLQSMDDPQPVARGESAPSAPGIGVGPEWSAAAPSTPLDETAINPSGWAEDASDDAEAVPQPAGDRPAPSRGSLSAAAAAGPLTGFRDNDPTAATIGEVAENHDVVSQDENEAATRDPRFGEADYRR
jgi:hypothetical protein